MNEQKIQNKKENPLLSLCFNIIIPVLILSKFSTAEYLGPKLGLVVALTFPAGYGVMDWFKQRKANFISIVGFISVLLTGIIGVFEFPSELIAYKEASVPLIIGLAVLLSMRTKYPLIKKLFFNETLMNMEKIEQHWKDEDAAKRFEKVLNIASYMVAFSFLVSSVLNFILAKILIQSPSGTEAFAAEMAKMTALSYPVIAIPSTIVLFGALWYVFNQLTKLTGLKFEELLNISEE
ncbi:MAG: hypothetical protein J6V30_04245 [Paludibacteraceae bacterium]|nr:hypothetical protein [Paludibacteraceae bacterium]